MSRWGTDEALTEDDAMRVFEEIVEAKNRSFQLGLLLQLRHCDVESICSQHKEPRDKLLFILIEALKKVSLTWKSIADALKSPAVDLPRLARNIDRAHCRPHTGLLRSLPSLGSGSLVARDTRTAPGESRLTRVNAHKRGEPSDSHLPSLVPSQHYHQQQNAGNSMIITKKQLNPRLHVHHQTHQHYNASDV